MRTFIFCLALIAPLLAGAAPLNICATTPDLGDIVRTIGGKHVGVTVFVKGREDPHYLQARPAFLKALSQADLFIQNGLGLESGWVPILVTNCANRCVMPGREGFLDVGAHVIPIVDDPSASDRSFGHVHPEGNPHYLLDPVWGVRAAGLITDRLGVLRPEAKSDFAAAFDAFRQRLGAAMVGDALASAYDWEKLATLYSNGQLMAFLEMTGETERLGGWVRELQPLADAAVAVDHANYTYFAHRFRLRPIVSLEPKPGLAPTTKHLATVVEQMRARHVDVILTTAYFPARHTEFVHAHTGARQAVMAHQVGARANTAGYIEMIDTNVNAVLTAFAGNAK